VRRILSVLAGMALFVIGVMAGRSWIEARQPATSADITAVPTVPRVTFTSTPTATSTSSATPTSIPETATPTTSPTPTLDATATDGPSPTPSPLSGLITNQTHCRHGPGNAYMEEWAVFAGTEVEVWGVDSTGEWLYMQPPGLADRCWLNESLLQLAGDPSGLPAVAHQLPRSDLYRAPGNIEAVRNGSTVIVTWDPVVMTPQDDRGYLFEAWLCVDGARRFTAAHTSLAQLEVVDEPGCDGLVGALLYTAEVHGYSVPSVVWWPEAP
jgi:hypothetical protein